MRPQLVVSHCEQALTRGFVAGVRLLQEFGELLHHYPREIHGDDSRRQRTAIVQRDRAALPAQARAQPSSCFKARVSRTPAAVSR